VVSIGAGFFIRVTNPIIRQLEERTLELEKLNREIEQRVAERTAELAEANKELEREIEERDRAQRAVRESEEKYRVLIKSVPAIVYKGYPDWRVEFVDPKKLEAITGHDPDKFNSGRSKWSDIIVEEDLETVRKSFIHALKTDKLFTREYRIKNVSGEIKWVHDRGHIVCNRLGEVEYISGVFYDITDRKRQEAEYQRTRDDSLKVQMINKTAMRYYQLEKPEGIIGICCFDALMGKSVPCEGCQIPAAIESGKNTSFERKGVMNPNNLEQVSIYSFNEKDH
jgi:PAS domain S-box-containing protein